MTRDEDTRRIGAELRRLRAGAGLTGQEAARRSGMSQPKISRLERGVNRASVEDVETLCATYRASTTDRDTLVGLVERLHRTVESAATIRRGGTHIKQAQIRRVEAAATELRYFQPMTIPGLLQTAEFTRRIYGLSLENDALVRAMQALADRQRILYDQDKRLRFMLTEQSLRWRIAPPEVMATQLHHIASLSTLATVEIAVIPADATMHEVPLNAWEAFDDDLVSVGLETATMTFTDPGDIAHYRRLYELLERSAVTGADARQLVTQLAHDHLN
ncbi:helix-turn-helix domain-containing protein [Allonocardiopsis opalescens]|uniref:Helix-turn-helix protein n=1 Tax=Allonocardiopsis opalescens TaxID=1144618 RepID=A0A2T0Q5R1_9ACTN|nr:helix-turn-helix transcriptional regulator [Allonocardiopsis opalescens]PRX99123.1 helix-turn-helix protein [Allonocardiopsis opalescens]